MINYHNSTKRLFVALTTTTALAGSLSLVSCQDYENGFDEEQIIAATFTERYEQSFIENFGEIAPDQNWGFDPMPIGGVDYGGTRANNTNSNEWESIFHYEVPGPRGGETGNQTYPWGWAAGDVTNYERAYVYWWFSTHQWPKTLDVNWNHFFVQNVWGQPEHTNTNTESSANFSGEQLGMDYLTILLAGGTKHTPSPSDASSYINSYDKAKQYHFSQNGSNYEHISDFNAGGAAKEQIMYVYDVSTKDFAYQSSQQTGDNFHNNWTIQRINGNYYLAFDYWHEKSEESGTRVEADGYYNDWILKLSNGEHIDDYYTRRIMCEDLGNTFDWDFNDVVFDVTTYYLNSRYYALITLQAAGGTMPIYVGDMNHEAHAMFGVSVDTPVNVDAPGHVQRPAVVYSIELTNDQLVNKGGKIYCQAEKIPVYVPSRKNVDTDGQGSAISVVPLESTKGKAPQKFACASTTYWMKELTNIVKGHEKFKDWVALKQTDPDQAVTDEGNYLRHYSEVNPLSDSEKLVLYEDCGKPQAISYYPIDENANQDSGDFIAWKTLWNTMVSNDGLNNPAYIQERKWVKDDADRSFITQAPNIYETEGMNDDPIAFSIRIWNLIEGKSWTDSKGKVGPFVQVWPKPSPFLNNTTANLSIGDQLNISNFVVSDAQTGVTISHKEGSNCLNIEGSTITANSAGTETITITYSGSAFTQASKDVVVTVTAMSPFAAGYTSGSTTLDLKFNATISDVLKTQALSTYIRSSLNIADFTANVSEGSEVVEISNGNIVAKGTGDAKVTLTYKGSGAYVQDAQLVINIKVKDPDAREYGKFYTYSGDFNDCGTPMNISGDTFYFDKSLFSKEGDIVITFEEVKATGGQINIPGGRNFNFNGTDIGTGSYQVILNKADWWSSVKENGLNVRFYTSANAPISVYVKIKE